MEAVKRKVGDKAWCYFGNHDGELSEGTVVHVFQLEGWTTEHYVLEFPTAVDPILMVRCPHTVSDAPDRKIGMWRGFHRKLIGGPPHTEDRSEEQATTKKLS